MPTFTVKLFSFEMYEFGGVGGVVRLTTGSVESHIAETPVTAVEFTFAG